MGSFDTFPVEDAAGGPDPGPCASASLLTQPGQGLKPNGAAVSWASVTTAELC